MSQIPFRSIESWESLDSIDWNEKLFSFYFCGAVEAQDPVDSLSVGAADLRKLVGDPKANIDDIEDAVSSCVRGMIKGDEKNGNGLMASMKKEKRIVRGIPQVVIGLFLTCLAASKVFELDETGLESKKFLNDFRGIMAKLLNVTDVHVDDSLADCWKYLQDYLQNNPVMEIRNQKVFTRKLLLPEVGNETQIGYSKKLVFPSRSDQTRLADVLRDEDLLEDDPPVDSVCLAITKKKKLFSKLFQNSFEDFLLAKQIGASQFDLSRHRFWNVVMTTCANQIWTSDSVKSAISLLVEPDGRQNIFWLVGSKDSGQLPERFVSEPIQDIDGWHQRIFLKNDVNLDPVASVLKDSSGLGRLSGLIRGGFIPFVLRTDHYLDLATPGNLVSADSALVRSDCLDAVNEKFGPIRDSGIMKTQFEEWNYVRYLKIGALAREDLENTALSQASILLKRIVRPQLKVSSPFSIGSEFLGWKELLPKIYAPGAEEISLSVNQIKVELIKTADYWTMKPENYFGEAVVEAKYGNHLIKNSFDLVDVPVSSEYKSPSSPDAWMIEVNQGTDVYSRYLSLRSVNSVQKIGDTVHRVYLGEVPGQFLDKPENAVAQISYFGEEVQTIILDKTKLIESKVKVNDKGLVRKWRKVVKKIAENPPKDLEDKAILSKMAKKNVFDAECSPDGGFKSPPTPYEDDAAGSAKRDVIISALATRLLRLNGIPIGKWREMLIEYYKIDSKTFRYIHRSWLEAGIIDELSSTRAPGLKVHARRPRIEIFGTEEAYIGAVTGLVIPKRLESLRDLASKNSISTAMNLGPSPLVPPHLRLRANSAEVLLDFANESGLEIFYLQEVPFPDEPSRESGNHPTNGYRLRGSFPTFTQPEGVELKTFESNRDPMIWAVRSTDQTAWSYSSSHAEFLACHFGAEKNLRRVSSVDIAVDRAFIPLSAARWVVSISGVPSGLDKTLQYTYRFPSPESVNSFFRYYEANVTQTLARWRNSRNGGPDLA